MSKPFISVRGVNQWVSALENAANRHEIELATRLRDMAKYVGALLKGRTFPVKQVSIQDAPSAKKFSGRKPITVRQHGNESEVEIREYWARARNKTVRAAVQAAGLGDDLVRDSLWISRKPGRAAVRRKLPGGPKQEVDFGAWPRLREWTRQGSKPAPLDYQYHRHALFLPVQALFKLAVDPALEYGRPKIDQKFEEISALFVRAALA